MSDRRRLILRVAVGVWLAVTAPAAETDAATPAEPAPSHKLSQHVREIIRAELPHYVPTALVEDEVVEFDSAAGVMKDDTLHLPTMRVREARKAPPTSTDWLTGRGRTEFALKRYPGTRVGNLFGLNNPWALARLTEDIEAERHDALKERVNSLILTASAGDRQTRELLAAALMYSGRPPPK